tara:strand:- start:15549 stop:16523 length:975 start_codon:yes stop_codon:yes gene_type:complete
MKKQNKNILVCGGGGFIGGHLAKDLKEKGYNVRVVDIKPLEEWYQLVPGTEQMVLDLELRENCMTAAKGMDKIYNLACNMGGMGFIENNHALCMLSVLINVHMLVAAKEHGVKDFLYSSSACAYPTYKQGETDSAALKEIDAYPADPESGYGWEKLFNEILTKFFEEDYDMNVRIARYHNVYGPYGTWDGGREKAPAALCRKIIQAKLTGNHEIEVWGDGEQTRSFMYIDDCITGMDKMWESNFSQPLNLGSAEMVSVNQLIDIIENIAGIKVKRNYDLTKPQGVRGRNSDNTLIQEITGWEPSVKLKDGLKITYDWIYKEMTN